MRLQVEALSRLISKPTASLAEVRLEDAAIGGDTPEVNLEISGRLSADFRGMVALDCQI
jgi:hypothetical protein